MAHSVWSGFYRKTIAERQQQLHLAFPHLFTTDTMLPLLQEPVANAMIENCIGTVCLPYGLALNFVIDKKEVVIPMAIEEPSVVAAVSGAAKLIAASGGFQVSSSDRNVVYAQLQLLDVEDNDLEELIQKFESRKDYFINLSNTFCKSMKERGGGVTDITLRKIKKSRGKPNRSFWFIVHFHVDVCDAMGANAASGVAEGMAPSLQEFFSARAGFRILSNLNPERLTKVNLLLLEASFQIPIESMAYKGYSGFDVANRIIEGYEWALDDPFRAVTHNKGIMNGIDAVAIATGQDWRAIEASCHAWASLSSEGRGYKPLTSYQILQLNGRSYFVGELELPLLVGTKGGVLNNNPVYAISLGLMKDPDSKELSKVLTQNFAAMRSLATEGIQKGHMALHAQNIAIAAGAPPHAISECVTHMIDTNHITRIGAKEYLDAHNLQGHLASLVSTGKASTMPPSMFYFEEDKPGLEHSITLNIAFKTYSAPVNLIFTKERKFDSELEILFGDKSYEWVNTVFKLLERIQLTSTGQGRSNEILSKKLKYLSILLNIITRRLYRSYPGVMKEFLKALLATNNDFVDEAQELVNMKRTLSGFKIESNIPAKSEELILRKSSLFRQQVLSLLDKIVLRHAGNASIEIGLPLLLAIWQVFECRVLQWVGEPMLLAALLSEQRVVLASIITGTLSYPPQVQELLSLLGKRLQTTLFLFCDAIRFAEPVDEDTIIYLNQVGKKLEIEQTILRDISPERLYRDLETFKDSSITGQIPNNPSELSNSFLLYLYVEKALGSAEIFQLFDSLEIKNLTREFYLRFSPKFNELKRPGFDIKGLQLATKLFMEYYKVTF